MERKKITSQKKTKIRKKDENKTEISATGYIRRNKSELIIESSLSETELLCDRDFANGEMRDTELFPRRCKIGENDIHETNRTNQNELKRNSFAFEASERNGNCALGNTSIVGAEKRADFGQSLFNSTPLGFDESFLAKDTHTSNLGKNHESNNDNIHHRSKSDSSLNKIFSDSSVSLNTLKGEEFQEDQVEVNTMKHDLELVKDTAQTAKTYLTIFNANFPVYNVEYFDKTLGEERISSKSSNLDVFSVPSTSRISENQIKTKRFEDEVISQASTYIGQKFSESFDLSKFDLDREALEKSVCDLIKYFESLRNNLSKQNIDAKYITPKSKIQTLEFKNNKKHQPLINFRTVSFNSAIPVTTSSLLNGNYIQLESSEKRRSESLLQGIVTDINSDDIRKTSGIGKNVCCDTRCDNKNIFAGNIQQSKKKQKKESISDHSLEVGESRNCVDVSIISQLSFVKGVKPVHKLKSLESPNSSNVNEAVQTPSKIEIKDGHSEISCIPDQIKKSPIKENEGLKQAKIVQTPKRQLYIWILNASPVSAEKAFTYFMIAFIVILLFGLIFVDFSKKLPHIHLQQLFH